MLIPDGDQLVAVKCMDCGAIGPKALRAYGLVLGIEDTTDTRNAAYAEWNRRPATEPALVRVPDAMAAARKFNISDAAYSQGWNACREEVVRLNGGRL